MGPSKNITKAQRRRFDIITREVGCIPCRLKHGHFRPAETNHLLKGYRIGHDATVPECPWHHRGIPDEGIDSRAMLATFGPSRALHGKAFREEFGDDEYLLTVTNTYVSEFERNTIGGGNHDRQSK